MYTLLFDLFAPDSPTTKDYAAIVEKLKSHFEPKSTNVLTHRYTFHRRNQGPNESIAEYVAELRRLASPCTFGTFLEQALRDRLVFGMRSESIQKRLLTEKEPTLSGVMEIALSLEAAQKNAHTLKGAEAPQLLKMDRRWKTTRKPIKTEEEKPCYRCGKTGHGPSSCVFREAKCFNCGKLGHVASVCKSKKKQPGSQSSKRAPHERAKWVDTKSTASQPSSDEMAEEVIWQVGATASRPYRAVLEVNGHPLTMEIDTGAAVSLISKTTQENLFPAARLDKSSLILLHVYCGGHSCFRTDGGTSEVWGVHWLPQVVHSQRQGTTPAWTRLARTPSFGLGQCPYVICQLQHFGCGRVDPEVY